ncbi:hypothetical protein ACP70R_018131 [Stipagrostis hirtigluma subsp. patula]
MRWSLEHLSDDDAGQIVLKNSGTGLGNILVKAAYHETTMKFRHHDTISDSASSWSIVAATADCRTRIVHPSCNCTNALINI